MVLRNVCMYMYILYMYVFLLVCLEEFIQYVCIYVCSMSVCKYIFFISTCVRVDISVSIYIYRSVCMNVSVYECIKIYIDTYIYK